MPEGFLADSSAGDHKQQSRVSIVTTLTRLALSLTLSLVSSVRRRPASAIQKRKPDSVLVAAGGFPSTLILINISIGGAAVCLRGSCAENLLLMTAAESKTFTAKWIEPAPPIGVFPPLDLSVSKTTAFFKSFPTIVLTIIAVTVA